MSSVISLGIGSPASIPLFLTFGLGGAPGVRITPEAGLALWALDRNDTLFALQGLDATETLMALARDETLFALQGYDGVETLRALDRDEALNPLEART